MGGLLDSLPVMSGPVTLNRRYMSWRTVDVRAMIHCDSTESF
jgi:hypothetical protein